MIKQALALVLTTSAAAPVTVAVSAQAADTVLRNAATYTVNAKSEVVVAVAIIKHRFVTVGTNKAVQTHIGPNTMVIDL